MNILLVNSNIVRCARSGYPLTPAPTGLISIAGVLRHHCIDTTLHYAKVDIDLLKQVAAPWPEVSTC